MRVLVCTDIATFGHFPVAERKPDVRVIRLDEQDHLLGVTHHVEYLIFMGETRHRAVSMDLIKICPKARVAFVTAVDEPVETDQPCVYARNSISVQELLDPTRLIAFLERVWETPVSGEPR